MRVSSAPPLPMGLRRVQPYALLTLAFIASRWAYRHLLGIEFDATPVTYFIQYIDQWFLEHHFWQSLLYLHHQAPLQNLLVGGFIRVFGEPSAVGLLESLYTLLGYGTALGSLHVLLRLGVAWPIATLAVVVYTAAPAAIVYENWLFYHQPVCFALVLSLLALVHYQRVKTFWAAFAYFSAITCLGLFRNTFGPPFLLAALGLLWLYPPLGPSVASSRRLLLRAAAVPLAVLCFVAIKPWVLTGHGYATTLIWGNLGLKIANELPPPELARLLHEKKVTRASIVFSLTDLRDYGSLRIPHAPTGVPLLDLERAPNGRWNAHALEYLLITRDYHEPEAKYLLTHYPETYLKSVGKALVAHTGSSIDDSMLPSTVNYERVQRVNAPLDRLFLREGERQWLLLIGLPFLVCYAFVRLWTRRGRAASQRGVFTITSYALFVIAYTTAAYLLVSPGDFSRYRVEIDPLYLLLTALVADDLRRGLQSAARSLRDELRRRFTRTLATSV